MDSYADGFRFDGRLDRITFDRYRDAVGRSLGPLLLFDLHDDGSLDLSRDDMEGVVAGLWSTCDWPERQPQHRRAG